MGLIPHHLKKKEYDTIGYVMIGIGLIFTFPQAFQIYDTKSAEDVNLFTYSGWLATDIFWIIYGYERKVSPIIAGSSVKLIVNAFVVYGILLYG